MRAIEASHATVLRGQTAPKHRTPDMPHQHAGTPFSIKPRSAKTRSCRAIARIDCPSRRMRSDLILLRRGEFEFPTKLHTAIFCGSSTFFSSFIYEIVCQFRKPCKNSK